MVIAPLERAALSYENQSRRFRINSDDEKDAYARQYCSIYRTRLHLMKPRIQNQPKNVPFRAIESLRDGEKCFIIGTVMKRIGQRPSILKEIAQDEQMMPEEDSADEEAMETVQSLVTNKDFLELEDEKQMVKLTGNISMDDVVTGCIVGCVGEKGIEDTFIVKEIIWPEANPQAPWPEKKQNATIAILSGLELVGKLGKDEGTVAAFNLFSRWLNGEMQTSEQDRRLAANIDRVVIAGDSIYANGNKEISSAARLLRLIPKTVEVCPVEAGEILDRLLANLTAKMRVDVMAGTGDPCPQMWPQQPCHRACFPVASVSGQALGLRSNPYSFCLGDIDFLATSGLNVADIMRMSNIKNSLNVMESLLRWQHIAPTAPDTLDAFPFEDRDPLILDRRPHVLICGNQSRGDSRWIEDDDARTLLLTVPKFSKTKQVVLLDMETMQVMYKSFDICLSSLHI